MADMEAEIAALWTATFGEPPCVDAPADMMLEILMRCSPVAPMPGEAFRNALLAEGSPGKD
jgi:hypothetical protein